MAKSAGSWENLFFHFDQSEFQWITKCAMDQSIWSLSLKHICLESMRGTEFLSTEDVALLDFARIIGMMFPPLFTVPKICGYKMKSLSLQVRHDHCFTNTEKEESLEDLASRIKDQRVRITSGHLKGNIFRRLNSGEVTGVFFLLCPLLQSKLTALLIQHNPSTLSNSEV